MLEMWTPFSESFTARDVATIQSLGHTGLRLVSIQISSVSEAAGKFVPDLALPRECVLVLLIRAGEVIYPRGDTALEAWDQLFAVVDQDSEEQFREALTRLG